MSCAELMPRYIGAKMVLKVRAGEKIIEAEYLLDHFFMPGVTEEQVRELLESFKSKFDEHFTTLNVITVPRKDT